MDSVFILSYKPNAICDSQYFNRDGIPIEIKVQYWIENEVDV